MIEPKRLKNGNLLVPMTARGPGGLIGDGMVEIGPDHPEFKEWEEDLKRGQEDDQPEPENKMKSLRAKYRKTT